MVISKSSNSVVACVSEASGQVSLLSLPGEEVKGVNG